MCTVCTNAAQSRTLDTAQSARKALSGMFRTASSAIPNGFPACGLAVGRRCRPFEARLEVRATSGVSRHYPDIRVAGICDQTKVLLPILDVSRNGTFSRVRGHSTRVLEL
jgi:hypothetical protein